MRKLDNRTQLIAAIVLAAIGAGASFLKPPPDPDALWKIVSTQCVPDETQNGQPAPCAQVDKDYAVLKDKRGKGQYLLIPTARVPGIEDPALLDAHAPNYFADAWAARHFTEDALKRKLPPQEILLAVNSAHGRTQNQLHIHIDCIAPGVRNQLYKHRKDITNSWMPFPVALKDHTYQVRRVDTLEGIDPFALLAQLPGARGDMGAETLAVAGAVFDDGAPGFILLADHAEGRDHASSEELQDHSCAVTHERAP